jgi:hypothetical protein
MGVAANIHRHSVGFARGNARNPDTRMPITWANCVSVPEAIKLGDSDQDRKEEGVRPQRRCGEALRKE